MNDPNLIQKILSETKTIAVVGFSSKPQKAGYYVPAYLQRQGFKIFPVNPRLTAPVLGEMPYASLADLPAPVDLVLIFQRSENVPPFVDAAIDLGAKAVWMQSGIYNERAAENALEAAIDVVMDACMMVEDRKYRHTI
jgi:hypothetical protein